jgi:hypothetical protein
MPWAEAEALFTGLHNNIQDDIDNFGYLGATAARSGDKEEALKIYKQLEEDQRPCCFGKPTRWRARIIALLGDKEGAVNLIRQATKEGYDNDDLHPCEDFESWGLALPHLPDAIYFITRFATHICAPGFFFMLGAGMLLFAKSRRSQG